MSYNYTYSNNNNNFVGLEKDKKYFLPKNFLSTEILEGSENVDLEIKKKLEDFEKQFEIFVNKFILENKKISRVKVSKSDEDGKLNEMICHSSKLEAWNLLEKNLKKAIINKSTNMNKYSDIFNSKSIEKTISRGTFILASNNSPIFNQGLLNIDKTYRIHYKDKLYKFASFILEFYKIKFGIKTDIKPIIKSMSEEFKNEYGFKHLPKDEKLLLKSLISILENIENHIELLTIDIKELLNNIKKLILGKEITVGINNFELAWEYLFNSCMKKIFGENLVFDEEEISIPETENYRNNNVGNNTNNKVMIKPDTIIIDKETVDGKSTLHIYDCKYKKFPTQTSNFDKDWIKQSIYIDNFLSTEINSLTNNLLVDSNIYLIYPGSQIRCDKKRVYNYNLYLIQLDILELLKIYNGTINTSLEDLKSKFLKDLCINENKNNCFYPHIRNKPYVPNNCFNGAIIITSSFNNNSDNRYSRYKEYLFGVKIDDTTERVFIEGLSEKIFSTKRITKEENNAEFKFI